MYVFMYYLFNKTEKAALILTDRHFQADQDDMEKMYCFIHARSMKAPIIDKGQQTMDKNPVGSKLRISSR